MESEIPKCGLVRVAKILQFIPVSKAAWWAGVKSGKFPQPIKLGPRTTCWYWQDILALIEKHPGSDPVSAPPDTLSKHPLSTKRGAGRRDT